MRLFLILLLLSGCATYQSIEVTYLPRIEVPEEVVRVVVVDRVNPDDRTVFPTHFDELDSYRDPSFLPREEVSSIVTDGFVEALTEVRWLQVANGEHLFMSFADTSVPQELIDSLCSQYNADAVLVLESLQLIHYSTAYIYPHTSPSTYYTRGVSVSGQWNLLLPDAGEIWFSLNQQESYDRRIFSGYREQPSDLLAAERAALNNYGYKFGTRLGPKVVTETRLMYKGGNQEMRKAYFHASRGNWQMANTAWKRLFEQHPNDRIRKKALNNLVVGEEAIGHFQAAMAYAKILRNRYGVEEMETHYNYLHTRYLDALKMAERLNY